MACSACSTWNPVAKAVLAVQPVRLSDALIGRSCASEFLTTADATEIRRVEVLYVRVYEDCAEGIMYSTVERSVPLGGGRIWWRKGCAIPQQARPSEHLAPAGKRHDHSANTAAIRKRRAVRTLEEGFPFCISIKTTILCPRFAS